MTLGVGGNDVGFVPVAQACFETGQPCYERPIGLDNFCPRGSPVPCLGSAHVELSQRYALVADCLASSCTVPNATAPGTTGLGVDDPSRIFLTEYPNITQDQNGRF